jgi:hypothetical protein
MEFIFKLNFIMDYHHDNVTRAVLKTADRYISSVKGSMNIWIQKIDQKNADRNQ